MDQAGLTGKLLFSAQPDLLPGSGGRGDHCLRLPALSEEPGDLPVLAQLSDHRESSGDEQEHRKKYVAGLEHKRLISTESTKVELCDGRKRNGNLRYTILPIQRAVDYFHEQQLARLELDVEQQRVTERLAKYGRVAPQEPLCAALPEAAGTASDRGLESGFGAVSEDFRGAKEKAG